MSDQKVWQVAEARDHIKEIIDAALCDGPQVIRRRGEDVVVVVSVRDWQRRQPTLKEVLLSRKGQSEDILAGGGKDIEINPVELD